MSSHATPADFPEQGTIHLWLTSSAFPEWAEHENFLVTARSCSLDMGDEMVLRTSSIYF